MGIIGVILLVIMVISAVLLVLVVLVQDDQGEGIGGIFGGGSIAVRERPHAIHRRPCRDFSCLLLRYGVDQQDTDGR